MPSRLGPGDAGEVSYYNLEKQTPVAIGLLFGAQGREGGAKGSCTRPSSMRAEKDHTIGHHQQAAYSSYPMYGLAFLFCLALSLCLSVCVCVCVLSAVGCGFHDVLQ